jgi:hypothetical protein
VKIVVQESCGAGAAWYCTTIFTAAVVGDGRRSGATAPVTGRPVADLGDQCGDKGMVAISRSRPFQVTPPRCRGHGLSGPRSRSQQP